MSKRQTLSQRWSLAAKKGWETRKRWATLRTALHDARERGDLNALSNGPPNIERDTYYSLAHLAAMRAPSPLLESIGRTNRERTAASNHPGSAHTNDQHAYAPDLLLTEGMRVEDDIGKDDAEKRPMKSILYGIRVLTARFVKALRGKA